MDNQFKRILDLVRRTGDRMVVTDPEGQDPVVVMDLDEYEAMLEAIGVIEESDFEGKYPLDEPPLELTEDLGPKSEDMGEQDPMLREAFPIDSGSKFSEESASESGENNQDEPDEQFYLEPVE